MSALRVTFVLPALSPTGGAMVAWRHAGELVRRGHAVTVLGAAPPFPWPWRPNAGLLARRWAYQRFVLDVRADLARYGVRDVTREVPRIDARTVPEGDVVVATSWETAEWVAALPARCGRPVYFLQDYEAWEPHLEARVDATWRLPFTRVAVSRWLVELGRTRFGLECRGPVGNGVEWPRFARRTPRIAGPITVGAVYHPSWGKGFDVLRDALFAIAAACPEARFLVFGRTRPHVALPAGTEYVWTPAPDEVPSLFARMDVFLHTSRREGWGLPPMEAMAAGCALVTTPTGGVPEFADETSAVFVPVGDAPATAAAAIALVRDSARRTALGEAAATRMRQHGWGPVHDRFEAELVRAARGDD